MVSPLFESVPPLGYGGTERVVAYLTEALVNMGQNVTLFASGDSVTSANLVSVIPEGLRKASVTVDPIAAHVVQTEQVFRRAEEFDILHFHLDYFQFPAGSRQTTPFLTTMHGRLDFEWLRQVFETYPNMPLSSISYHQRRPLADLRWVGNIYHGLPASLYDLHPVHDNYAVFIGRISAEKGLDRAIEISRRAGMRLKVAAKVDKADKAYYDTMIHPLLKVSPHVEFIGEVGDAQKNDLLGNAAALLFPIDWPEPFGLVMIEAMACGTPCIAFNRGSVPEVIRHGISGFIVDSIAEAVEALQRIDDFDRAGCRREFEKRFTAERMAKDYVTLFKELIQQDRKVLYGKSHRRHYPGQQSVLRPGDLVAG
jgi:glycosyltransferase involved in cell wall biosynthesis